MRRTSTSGIFAFLFALLLLAGCRTYGGYDSPALNNEQLRISAAEFADAAAMAETDFQRLSGARNLDPALVSQFGAIVGDHLAASTAVTAALDKTGELTYRAASRKLGAVVTMKRAYAEQYQSVLRAMAGDHEIASPERTARYSSVPAAYYRAGDRPLSVDDVIARSGN